MITPLRRLDEFLTSKLSFFVVCVCVKVFAEFLGDITKESGMLYGFIFTNNKRQLSSRDMNFMFLTNNAFFECDEMEMFGFASLSWCDFS